MIIIVIKNIKCHLNIPNESKLKLAQLSNLVGSQTGIGTSKSTVICVKYIQNIHLFRKNMI